MEFIKNKEVRKPGLYAGDKLIANWKLLVDKGMLRINGDILAKCLLQDPGTLVIDESIRKIGDNAFSECPNLYDIVLPKDIQYIGFGAFSGCLDLEKIYVADIKKLENMFFSE